VIWLYLSFTNRFPNLEAYDGSVKPETWSRELTELIS